MEYTVVVRKMPKQYKKTVIHGKARNRSVTLTDSDWDALLTISPAGYDGKPSISKLLAKMAKNIKENRHV
jgi:hypothetical protein